MEYPYTVWYTTHSLHVKQYHKRNSLVLASVGFGTGVGCWDSCPWCYYHTCSLADVFILYCWDPLAVSFSRVSFVGELPSEQNNFVSEGLLCQVGSFPLLIYTLISISRARRTGPDFRPQVLVLYRTAITDGGERLNFKTLIALSLENINGEKIGGEKAPRLFS